MTALSGKLPKGDRNGLDELVAQFVKDPHRQHIVIAVVDVGKIVQNVDTGDFEPTLRILRIEQISPEDARDAETLVRRSLERRVGSTVLPFEMETEISAIFEQAAKEMEKHLPEGTTVEFKKGHQPPPPPPADPDKPGHPEPSDGDDAA